MNLLNLRPNNWFLSEEKVRAIRTCWDKSGQNQLPPILIAKIDEEYAIIDGNTRAFVALERGDHSILCEIKNLPDIEGPTELYEFIHREGPKRGVSSLNDLRDKILPHPSYHIQWISFCESLIKIGN